MSINNWWIKQSSSYKRSWKLLGFIVILIVSTYLLRMLAPEYMAIPMWAVFAAIIFGTPFYIIWEIYRAYIRSKESSDYVAVRLGLGLTIMSLTALIWIGALILVLVSINKGGEGIPFGMFIIPALIFGAVGQKLTKSAFSSKTKTD